MATDKGGIAMTACNKCWDDAYRAQFGSGSQSEHYRRLLEERKDNPCSKAEQVFGNLCCRLNTDDSKGMTQEINEAIDVFVVPLETEIKRLKVLAKEG